ncbi:MAG: efflux RND transporter permease subunit [Phycisphaerae bacterium]
MIERIIKTFLDAPVLAVILCAALIGWGWQSFKQNPKDAIPDIAENQTIVFTEWAGRSPKDVDEQVTYPLTVALQGVPGVNEIRATSGFGWSIVYVVFHENVEFYWARSRVLERLNVAQENLPDGVTPRLGPDATALGQVFWYTVENGWYSSRRPGLRFREDGTLTDASRAPVSENDPVRAATIDLAEPYTCPITGVDLAFSRRPLDELRSIQDFDVKLALESVEGVSEVASVGGFVRQYQIDVNPEALRAFDVSLRSVVSAVKQSNVDVGAKVVEQGGIEILVRGVGFLGGGARSAGTRREREQAAINDIENIVVKATDGTPVYIRQLASVTTGPDFRRGALDKMGAEAVGGCVVMRFGENPLTVIQRVKTKIAELESGLPPGVRINAFYDRTALINETMHTLGTALWQELVITVVAVVLFLLHFRSSLVIALTLPLAVLFAFICMQVLNVSSNIMSLAGIAIAIGTMVDMGIVMTENIYQHLTSRRSDYTTVVSNQEGERVVVVDAAKRRECIRSAASEVGAAILTAISTTVISFLPVFFLEGQSAKLFAPLAWTKTFCLVGAVVMALVIVPPLASVMLRDARLSRARTAVISALGGTIGAMLWSVGTDAGSTLERFGDGVRSYLRLRVPFDACVIGVILFVLIWLTLRERTRDVSENPVSRIIRRVYEPLLRWILGHKLLFLVLPASVVVWGLAIWLGWGRVLGGLVKPLRGIGLRPEQWSLSWWVSLGLGLSLGLVVFPLLVDTVQVIRRRPLLHAAPRWRRRLGYATIAVLIAVALHFSGFMSRGGQAIAAVYYGPKVDAPRSDAPTADQVFPIEAAIENSAGIGQEFMPPLDEGDFLYMPSVLPAGSINTVMEVMQKQDRQFAEIDEVDLVVGKLGRIESSLDPAPVGMLETLIALKPRDQWPYEDDPDHPDRKRRRTMREIWQRIQDAGRYPGVLPSVELQPIRTRVEMLSTGLNANIGLKVYGDSLESCERVAVEIEQVLRSRLRGASSISAIRTNGKPYLEFHIDREAIARYGINIRDVQDVIEVAVGGKNLTMTYEGLDRYPVRVRYERELRDDPADLERILVPTSSGAQIPIAQVATIRTVVGPMSIRREGAKYVSYVTMTNVGIDETSLVKRGQAVLDQAIIDGTLDVPDGYYFRWSGSYERNVRAKKRLSVLLPLVLIINLVLIYLQFKRISLALVIFLAIPVAFAGGFILLKFWPDVQSSLYLMGVMDRAFEGEAMYLTVAVWVGFIALFGIAVDDGIVMGTYLDQTFSRRRITRFEEIRERVVEAGLRRIRPCLMTTVTTLAALVPVLLSTGRGSDVMVPMAIPVFGGMAFAVLTIFVVPACYCGLKESKWRLGLPDRDFARPQPS